LLSDSPSNDFGCPESFVVDIEEADLRICQLRKRQNVDEQIFREDSAPGANKGYFPF
jgi:hypothetical protein